MSYGDILTKTSNKTKISINVNRMALEITNIYSSGTGNGGFWRETAAINTVVNFTADDYYHCLTAIVLCCIRIRYQIDQIKTDGKVTGDSDSAAAVNVATGDC